MKKATKNTLSQVFVTLVVFAGLGIIASLDMPAWVGWSYWGAMVTTAIYLIGRGQK